MTRVSQSRPSRHEPALWGATAPWLGSVIWASESGALSTWRLPSLALYRRIHIFGFAAFVTAIGTGLSFTLLQDPRMSLLTTLPMALIPLFGVGLSGASHIVALHTLSSKASQS